MGDEGETFSSSGFNKPLPDDAGKLKDAALSEFVSDSGDNLEKSGMLEEMGGDEAGDIRAEAEVGGGRGLEGTVLEENAGGESFDKIGVEEKDAVTNEGGGAEVLVVQAGAEAVVEIVSREGATSVGDVENSDSNVGAGGGETLFIETENFPAAYGLEAVEEEAKTVETLLESSIEMTVPEKEAEKVEEVPKADVEESSHVVENEIEKVEEMLNADDGNSSIKMAAVEREAEKVKEVPKAEVADEVMDLMDVKEDVVEDTELGDTDRTLVLENDDGHETAVLVDDADTKQLPFSAAATLDEGKEAVVEDRKDGEDETIVANLECAEKDDTGMDAELLEEMSLGKVEPVAETGEGGDSECCPNSDEVEKTVADEEPALIGSEMEYGIVAEEETSYDEKLASSQEETTEEMVTGKGSPLSGMEMENDLGEEQELVVGQEKEAMEMENNLSSGEEQELVEEQEEEVETETTEVDNDNAESTPEMDEAKQVPQDEGDEGMAAIEETETDAGESSRSIGEKHKKGRNSKVSTNSRSKSRKIMEEDVCFVCFDGGDLVLCDRRGCPKAYHPSCVNRDEAFFRSKGRWTCGWHLCHICKKAAHYMCYTCPNSSLCKGCIKDAVILCVRGNKGFCETCKRTIMLIEDGWEGSHDGKKIDFDDKTSWEFLFKDYYTELKSKLSLTSAEIEKAKNPWKGSDVSTRKEEAPETPTKNKDGGTSGNDTKDLEGARPKKKRAKKKQSRSLPEEEDSADAGISSPTNEEWASKELLEFVLHMKNGDGSAVSQYDVQALLLEYIQRNDLRDPRNRSHILCDSRLRNLFGKRRVGHFEMLKLLESHFLLKEDSHTDDVEGSIVDNDTQVGRLEADENDDTETTGVKEKKRKARRKSDKGPLSNRLDYAAIDTHNVKLIYLRRKLMEDILEEGDDFQNKVVGTFVRIRISGNNQKQDLYRLVQVVGTSKADEPYKFGKRTTDLMLEILNLNKTEIVSIDTISNQEFTEDECKRLRQSVKCGLLNRMTVGDILDKAMELQAARVDDWLESETLRLSHLRDRASDMGHRKELRECVEKLQVLKTPEERLRRLEEIPKIHVDPKMDPSNESEDNESESDDDRQEDLLKTTGSVFATRRGRAPISPGSDVTHKESWNGGNGRSWESRKNVFSKTSPASGEYASGQSSDMGNNNTSWNEGRERVETRANLISSTWSENTGLISNARSRSESLSGMATNSPIVLSTNEVENVVQINETQKMWHYKDPAGKIQGPFSMTQLRKWSNTGYFPNGLKIWRTGENQDVDSIILTDALAGRFQKASSVDSQLSKAVTRAAVTPGFSSHYVKTSETPLHLSREEIVGQRSNIEQNRGLHVLQMGVVKGSGAPFEVPKLSPEKWTRTDLHNLPSPTPGRGKAGDLGEQGRNLGRTSYLEGKQSPSLSHHVSVSSGNASAPISRDHLMNGRENDFGSAIGSAHALQATLLAQRGEARPVEDHGQITHVDTHGWGGPPPPNIDPNTSTPVPGQQQAYNPWSVVTPPAQNPAVPALPQPEYWGPMGQNNLQSMPAPAMPNVAWGGSVDPAHANPSMGWVAPAQVPSNMNWAPTVPAPPPPGNANAGWVMPPGDAGPGPGPSIQGQMPGNVNAGWVAQPSPMGSANAGWAPPVANVGPAVQVPVPGPSWGPMPNGNQGPLVQGWSGAPPGNQGWAPDRSGGNFSGQRDNGSQGGDSGYGPGGRPWNNRQSSFGRRPEFRNRPRDVLCPYNANGQCRKGNRCNYLHS